MRIALVFPLTLFVLTTTFSTVHAQDAFRDQHASKVAALEKKNAAALVGVDSWLFLASELRFLAQGVFWGDAAAKVARTRSVKAADPLPAIVDFHQQLKQRGIHLLVVPVPAKAAIYPEKVGVDATVNPSDSAPFFQEFMGELRKRGIDVLDLTSTFTANRDDQRGPVYCRTDSHWSGAGCVLAAQRIAEQIRPHVPNAPRANYQSDWKEISITGDLAPLAGDAPKPGPERLNVRQVSGAVGPDANSPVLVIGDSHTLVFHEFLSERAGLIDQLAAELGFAVDLIGTRGSGATPVRVSMYRRSRSEPEFLAKKKVVVWCFAAREFTEADQGWVVQPIAK